MILDVHLTSSSSASLRFFCPPNEPKVAGTEPQASSAQPNANFSPSGARLHKPNTHTVRAVVRTISGSATHLSKRFWISTGLREFWDMVNVLRLAAVAWCKHYCLRSARHDEL
jgi:hypothetical protein